MSDALPVVDQQLATGEGWVLSRGRDTATGRSQLLLVLTSADLAEVRRRLAVAGSVAGRHLAEVVDALAAADGSVVVVCAAPGGPSLAEVVSRRGLLSAGEVVTLVAPLARALGAVHSRGVRLHGVVAETLWLSADGRPVLVPISLGAQEADDLTALADLGTQVIDQSAPRAAAVIAVLDDAVARRLDANGLAAALLRAAPAVPVRVDGPSSAPARRFPPLRARPLLAMVVVALVAIGIGGVWGRHDGTGAVLAAPPLSPVSTPAPAASSWLPVMSQLERTRARAYVTGDISLLTEIYSPESSTGESDRRLLATMTAKGERAVGLHAYVESVDVIRSSDSRATLRVTDALTSYDVIGPDARVLRHGSGRPSRAWLVTLVRAEAGWRILTVTETCQGPRRQPSRARPDNSPTRRGTPCGRRAPTEGRRRS